MKRMLPFMLIYLAADGAGSGGPPPSPPKDKPQDQGPQDQGKPGKKFFLRHKTEYRNYRRAGLILTQNFKEYELSADQLPILQQDPWVEFKEPVKQ